MLRRIVDFSLDNRWLVPAGVMALLVAGGYVLVRLPIDAFPDLTNNQVVAVDFEQTGSFTETGVNASGAIFSSTPGWAWPTEPNLKFSNRLNVSEGQVSVSP